jgi:hypothetical protein
MTVPSLAPRLRYQRCPAKSSSDWVTIMGERLLVVVCAWCNRVISTAPAGAGVTHTICQSCLDITFSPVENGMERHGDHGAFRLPDRYFGLDDL